MYAQGQGVPQDYDEAMKWLRLAANQGDAVAELWLGRIYFGGRDFAEAVKWYRLAADQGNAQAQYRLGFSYSVGLGVPRYYAEAVKWNRLAADQGNADAQFWLGIMYDNGQGVPKDYVLTYMWLVTSGARFPWKPPRASAILSLAALEGRYIPPIGLTSMTSMVDCGICR